MSGAVFLDRDGVICANRADYVKGWPEFVFLPGALPALAALHQAGYQVVVVTNQSAVGRGLLSVTVLDDIHSRMQAEVQRHGGYIAQILYCPHLPEDHCDCRKPRPGMLLAATRSLGIELHRAYLIGDACSDILAGQAVGCHTFLVLTGRGPDQLVTTLREATHNFTVVANLMEAVKQILNDKRQLTIPFSFENRW